MAETGSRISASQLATAFDELRIRLSGLEDCYARLYEIADFLSSTLREAHPTSAVPYLLELHDDLLAATAFLSPPEANPSRLEWGLRQLEHWQPRVPPQASSGYSTSITRIRLEIMVNAALLGDFEPAAEYLGADLADTDPSEDVSAYAKRLSDLVSIHQPGWSTAVSQRLKKRPISTHGGTWGRFPAVYSWSNRDAHSRNATRGQLCQASCRIDATTGGEDELRLDGTSMPMEDETQLLNDVARAGRRMLQTLAPETLHTGYSGTFRLSASQVRLEGQSMRSLLSVLFVLEVVRYNDLRTSFNLDPSIVISGDIDKSGRFIPVDASSVNTKVEAAFFSQTERLVLPHHHQREAREVADRLHELYPHRRLEISGVESIFDVFADRRLVDREIKSRSRYAVEQAWRNRSRIVSTAAVLLLFATVFLLYPSRIDPHIVDYGFEEGGQLNFLNAEGEAVHSVAVGDRMHRAMTSKGANFIAIDDVNDDGFNDAYWAVQTNYESSRYGKITGIDGATGDTLLSYEPNFVLRYPNDISIESHDMVPGDMTFLDANNDGKLELLVAFEHAEYYPSILATINPLTGDILQRYDHPGALREMRVADTNGDGEMEILMSGINNSMRKPVFIALDPKDFSDTGPVTRTSYKPFPERIGKELAYYVFPESPISDYNPVGSRIADWINLMPDGKFAVSVWDSYRIIEDTQVTTSFRVTFDQQLRPVSIGTNDDWDSVYQEAASQGLVPEEFTNEMKLEMLSNIERIR